ncbi:MAG: DUF4270 domain-containing protein [Flavobacteriaceae bacterium]|nr:DUF4270 domain-containing protein [Bacteroidia bacterium]NNK88737.1 DUF4270 domain-containing protein [Flavobacteriaceae bacterium]
MKHKTLLSKFLIAIFLLAGLAACDKDFASIGTDIIGQFNFETESVTYPVVTYNKDIGPVQTNILPSYFLGYNNDQLYGSFSASIVGQLIPSTFDPVFGENVVLDSVVLNIPYFSRLVETDEEGNNVYEIDSIFGDSPIKLSVFRNDFFLRDFNPDLEFEEELIYYANKTTSDGNVIGDPELEGELLYEDENFLPSADQIVLTTIDEETSETTISQRLAPGIRVLLDNPNSYWESLIFDKEGEPELSNESNFRNHFRGLYIRAEAMDIDGTLMMLNIGTNATLTLHYTSETEDTTDDGTDTENTTEPGTFTMSFSGNTVNFIEDSFIGIVDGDPVEGDEQLFLKGSQGSMAIVNLFNGDEDGNSPELQDFKSQNWLINQAELEFYVDQSAIQDVEPDRIYLYNLETNRPLIDYFLDQSVSSTQVNAKIDHLQPLVRVDDDPQSAGIKYTIELTEHINNLFLRDSTNVKLGLVVTTNVNNIEILDLEGDDELVEASISGTFLSPRGTVLFGNNAPDEDKQVKLKIYYTEPDN